jgi:hypothetical protein
MHPARSPVTIRQRIPAVEASSLASKARLTMLRLGVTWLAVRHNDVVVGTIDEQQLAPLPAGAAVPVSAVMGDGLDRVRSFTTPHLTSPIDTDLQFPPDALIQLRIDLE